MKNNNIALKTLGIKARIANQIRKDLYKKKIEEFSDKDKINFFDLWFKINHTSHWELNDYKQKRKYKREIQRLREERKLKV